MHRPTLTRGILRRNPFAIDASALQRPASSSFLVDYRCARLASLPSGLTFRGAALAYQSKRRNATATKPFGHADMQELLKSTPACNAALEQLVANGQSEEAFILFDEMGKAGLTPDLNTFNLLGQVCVNGRKPERVATILSSMKRAKAPAVTYYALLNLFINSTWVEEALMVVGAMRELHHRLNESHYTSLIDGFTQIYHTAKTLTLDDTRRDLPGKQESYPSMNFDPTVFLKEMMQAGMTPNVFTYTALIDCCMKSNQLDHAMKLFDMMTTAGVEPNEVTYTAIIDGFIKDNKLNKALEYLDQMKKAGLVPTVTTYTSVFHGCLKNNLSDRAMDFLDEMRSHGLSPNRITFTSLIGSCLRENRLDHALNLLKQMKEQNVERDTMVYNTLIEGCVKSGQMTKALGLFKEMQEENLPANRYTYNALINGFALEGKLKQSLSLVEEMKAARINPDVATYTALMKNYTSTKQFEEARALLSDMKSGKLPQPNTFTYNTLLVGLLGELPVKPDRLNVAFSLLDEMKASNNPKQQPNFFTYERLIRGCIFSNKLDQALSLLEEGKSMGWTKSMRNGHSFVISGLCQSGRVKEAFEVVEAMKKDGLAPDVATLHALVRGMSAKSGGGRGGAAASSSGSSEDTEVLEFVIALFKELEGSGALKKEAKGSTNLVQELWGPLTRLCRAAEREDMVQHLKEQAAVLNINLVGR